MEKIITYENLRSFAYSNDDICKKPIKGIVVSFFGCGGIFKFDKTIPEGPIFGDKGIIFIHPYTNPWAWMNKQTVAFVDEIIDILFKKYELSEDTPIVSSGGSMGGYGSIMYSMKAKRTPVACVSNCPVCDLPGQFNFTDEFPRTMYSAFFNEEGTLEEVLTKASPLHNTDKLPDIDYHFVHCEKDDLVTLKMHSEPMYEKMKDKFNVTLDIVPDKGHCDLSDEAKELYNKYIFDSILK